MLRSLLAAVGAVAMIGGAVPAAPAPAPAPKVAFQPIHEFWDANRVARHRDVTAACSHDRSTLQITTCSEYRAENSDVATDRVRAKEFAGARSAAAKEAINRDDRAWIAERSPVCDAGYASSQGTIVQVLVAGCLAAESAARLDTVEGRAVPTAQLRLTDSIDPVETPYATAGDGTRIGAIDTQGDATGGAVIAWVIIAGYRGFTVRPAAFPYVDGSFVDRGIVEGGAAGHHVAAGKEYVFDVDYSTLAKDPLARAGKGRFEYRQGRDLVGAWR